MVLPKRKKGRRSLGAVTESGSDNVSMSFGKDSANRTHLSVQSAPATVPLRFHAKPDFEKQHQSWLSTLEKDLDKIVIASETGQLDQLLISESTEQGEVDRQLFVELETRRATQILKTSQELQKSKEGQFKLPKIGNKNTTIIYDILWSSSVHELPLYEGQEALYATPATPKKTRLPPRPAPTKLQLSSATMSTPPPQATTDLQSPITSPLPKRTKTSHSQTENMTIAAFSEPTNVPVPVTRVQDGPHLLIKKLSDKAKLPTRGSAFAAGYDLYASKATVIPARGKGLVDTDLSMAVPAGTYGRIAPRSGLAAKNYIDTGAGVIDADYRGQVKVLLFNHSDVDFTVNEHDRVAQLVLERIYTPEVVEVEELEESVRGEGGFGSTGIGAAGVRVD